MNSSDCAPHRTVACLQELDPAAASLIRGLAASQAAAGGAPITLIDGLAVHARYLQPLLPHPEVRLTSWVAKVHALCWVTSFQQVRVAMFQAVLGWAGGSSRQGSVDYL